MNVKLISLGGLLVGLSVLFQCIPVFFTEIFVLATIFSALPVYVAARLHPRGGLAVFLAAGFIISLVSFHEGLFFLCTNGLLGFILGAGRLYVKRRITLSLVAAVVLTGSLCLLNFIIGIRVFGVETPGSLPVQLACIFLFVLLYSRIYLGLADYLFGRMDKVLNLKIRQR